MTRLPKDDLRDTFASRLLAAGIPVVEVSAWMGHTIPRRPAHRPRDRYDGTHAYRRQDGVVVVPLALLGP